MNNYDFLETKTVPISSNMRPADLDLILQKLNEFKVNEFSLEATPNSLSFNFLEGEKIVFSSYARPFGSQISICGFGAGDRNRNYLVEYRSHIDPQ
jgi:hypothetical protein